MPVEDRETPQGIQSWQQSLLSGSEKDREDGKVARLLHGCLALYDLIIREIAQSAVIPKTKANSLLRSHTTLKLWADGHRVSDGRLDEVLERSKRLQQITLSTLNSLCGVLTNRLTKLVWTDEDKRASVVHETNVQVLYDQTKWITNEVASDSESDSESESSSNDDKITRFENILEEVKMYTQLLVELNIALECPAIDPHCVETEACIDEMVTRYAYDYYTDLIITKYPEAHIDLANCLGKLNWARYQRMQSERSNNLQSSVACAAAVEQSAVSKSEYRDSGLGTSVSEKASTYAETITSFVTGLSIGERLQVPPIPPEGKNGQRFECLACGQYIRVHTNREWRKHLFGDLQPYSCLFHGCSFSSAPFMNRKTWAVHLELEHKFGPEWASIPCPLCQKPTGSGQGTIVVHLSRHMEDLSLATLPRGIGSEANSEIDSESRYNEESQISVTEARSSQEHPSLVAFTVQCVCKIPIYFGNMVICKRCYTWQHESCCQDPSKPLNDDEHVCLSCMENPSRPATEVAHFIACCMEGCEQTFDSLESFKLHRRDHHKKDDVATSSKDQCTLPSFADSSNVDTSPGQETDNGSVNPAGSTVDEHSKGYES